MKKFLQKFTDLELTIILEGIIGVVAVGLSCIGFAFNQPGWAIGVATGVIVSMISTLFVFKGSEFAMKGNKAGLYLLFFFLRMALFVGMTVFFALMQYKVHNHRFDYSIWGGLIGYTPMFIILIIGQVKGNRELDKKIEEKNKEE